MKHRNIFQDDKAESANQEVFRPDRKYRKNTNPDCADCVSSVHETAAAVYIWRQKLYKLYVGIKSLPF